jgi:hypothetical protein
MRWRFVVYGGLYEIAGVRDTLLKVFGDDERYVDGRVDGQTAMFAFSVDDEGRVVEKSAMLSACAWAIGRALRDRSGGLDEFEAEQREFADELNRLAVPKAPKISATTDGTAKGRVKAAATDAAIAGAGAATEAVVKATVTPVAGGAVAGVAATVAGTFVQGVLKPTAHGKPETAGDPPNATASTPSITAAALHAFVRDLAGQLGIAGTLHPAGVRVKCFQVSERRAGEAVEQDFLNSFIAGDLSRVADALARGDAGAGLASYLTEAVDTAGRRDVRRDTTPVIEGVAPRDVPAGRWPAGTGKPLVLSQQFAVNRITALRDEAGIFAVNGPPGTGKTTMLRDIIAALIVERARRLADLGDPLDAFTTALPRARTGGYVPSVWRLAPEITGFEMVVASKNNGAVANVTTEIPGLKAIDDWADEASEVDYFARLASHVLGREAWGMVAAQLGNMEHRSLFANRFWWSTDPDQPLAAGDGRQRPTYEDRRRLGIPAFGMQDVLEDAAKRPPVLDWKAAVGDFRSALAEVQTLTDERQDAATAFAAFDDARRRQQAAHDAVTAAEAELAQLREQRAKVDQTVLRQAREQHRTAARRYEDHLHHRPGLWVTISTLGRAGREWHRDHSDLRGIVGLTERHLDEALAVLNDLDARIGLTTAKARQLHEDATQIDREVAEIQRKTAHAHATWTDHVPYGPRVATDEQLQQCAPWADEAYTAARSRLFFQALRLHKTFALLTASRLRGNLSAATMIIKGDDAVVTDESRLAAWQSLFLLVPVVSTTFASLPRLFSALDRESLGWLFIDEAGQAAPQEAVGGVWRARRTVVVGDPLQLEPIVNLPLTVQHALRKTYEVPEVWTPDGTSVQGVADRVARYGTYLPPQDGGDEPIWIGAPLRVHRRCDRPMFEVCNRIAYGGDLMIYGTRLDGAYYDDNAWLDVDSSRTNGNWVPAEGDALRDLIADLLSHGVAAADIRVISPFRDAVRGSKDVCRQVVGGGFADDNVGTVHTVQGKESDVVILVLGGRPDSPGVRRWASQRPNLLNVAVSRARRRLYVIGNHRLWGGERYFTALAAELGYPASARRGGPSA